MRKVAVGSLVTLILFTGLLVSQAEAKNKNNDEKGKNKHEYNFVAKADKHDGKEKNKPEHQIVAKSYTNGETPRSVPIPGTLLLMGGGLVGLVAWRARQRKLRA